MFKQTKPPFDLVKEFYKQKIDLDKLLSKRKTRKHISGGIDKYSGEWGDTQKKHLLNRILIGYSKHHLNDLEGLNLDETIDLIFQTEAPFPLPLNDYFNEVPQSRYDEINEQLGESKFRIQPVPPGETWVESAFPGNQGPYEINESLRAHILKHQLRQKTSIHWKLVFFLHNLLPTNSGAGASSKASWQYIEMLFNAPYQSYKQTIENITKDPNMLWYLNLQFSQADNPDENFAREIQELFTIGKGPNAKYTENDVKAFSKILVGWNSDFTTHETPGRIVTEFRHWNHDKSDKKLSAFYGNKLIRGREGDEGAKEFDELLDAIFQNKEVSYYISRRLYQFFVYPDIDTNAEQNIIEPMAKKFRDNNFSLIEPLKLLLKSEHFFDQNNFNSLIKSPLEFFNGVLKTFEYHKEDAYTRLVNRNSNGELELPEKFTNPLSREFYMFKAFQWNFQQTGLSFYEPPSVSGWPPYYQAPVYDLFWINSDTMSKRANFAEDFRYDPGIQYDDVNDSFVHYSIDYFSLVSSQMTEPENLNSVIPQFLDLLFTVNIDNVQLDDLKQIIIGSVNEAHYTELFNRVRENPTKFNKQEFNSRFREFTVFLLMMPEINVF